MTDTTYDITIKERQEKEKQTLVGVLKELPIIQAACKRAGISRDTYYRWRREDKIFRRESENALNQGIEFVSDMSESQLITLIKDQKMPAIAMWLKHNHPRYGSKNRSYTPIASNEELTPEEEQMALDALKLVSGNVVSNHKHD
ncbi:MAG: hypothetical protein AAB484_02385 [Patescibacteria group bacterium]